LPKINPEKDCPIAGAKKMEETITAPTSYALSYALLDAIINSSSDGLFVCDTKATVVRMNPASEKIHQIKAAKVVGRNIRVLIEEGFIDRSAALETCLSGKQSSLLQNKNGRKIMSLATPVHDNYGNLTNIVVSERDISEIDRLQKELEEKENLTKSFKEQIHEMQISEAESRKFVAKSQPLIRAFQQALKVSKFDSSVLLLGESGVGKGVIANLIHQHSKRGAFPLLKINCGAIPESLIEAELFGYEKGAFTGALDKGKPGLLELANKGTLFLDEIAELPLASQVKLLSFLEDGRVTRLGATTSRSVNVRVLAATHRALGEMIKQGLFRQDLFYRLNVVPINIPAVRERKECIVPLLRHYIDHFNKAHKLDKRISREALDQLEKYTYPGNVRELMNICERLVVMTETDVIGLSDLPFDVAEQKQSKAFQLDDWVEGKTLSEAVALVEKQCLKNALRKFDNQYEAADYLKVNQSTITRKLQKYSLK